jgi:hypothetical protein
MAASNVIGGEGSVQGVSGPVPRYIGRQLSRFPHPFEMLREQDHRKLERPPARDGAIPATIRLVFNRP